MDVVIINTSLADINADDIEIASKTIIYSLQGMIMLNLSSNSTGDLENIKAEVVDLVDYLIKNKKSSQGGS